MAARALCLFVAALLVGCAIVDSEHSAMSYPTTVHCAAPSTRVTSGGCEAIAGDGPNTIIVGTILAGEQVLRNGSVLIDANGRIVDVACDLHADPRAAGATVLACADNIVSPGLINAHDHIWYNQRGPSKPTGERYAHRHHWRLGLEGHRQPDFERATGNEQVAWAEMRHALSGTTAIAGMGGVPGLVRNLEDAKLQGELHTPAAFAAVFPLGDAAGNMLQDSCNYPDIVVSSSFASAGAFQAHVAEGVDREAANEIACLTGRKDGSVDVTGLPSAFVHFVAATTDDAIFMRDHDASVIWSPRSNPALYGYTANVTLLDRLGVNVALSTDWLPSGSMNLLRELQCAAEYSRDYLGGYFSNYAMWRMVTANAARSFALQDELGTIAAGQVADIAIFRNGLAADPFADIVNAGNRNVLLVLRAGRALAGSASLIRALGEDCDTLPAELTCGDELAVCLDSADGSNMHSILDANRESYLLLACDAIPEGEPSCRPSWPGRFDGEPGASGDTDGDGVANNIDNCPTIFNPPRPMDDGRQPDWDSDAFGDACDEKPLE